MAPQSLTVLASWDSGRAFVVGGDGGVCGIPPRSRISLHMQVFGSIISVSNTVILGLIILRAFQGKYLWRFPFLYSYVGFVFCTAPALYFVVQRIWPESYPSWYWLYYLTSLVVEFAVLIEIADQIFRPYPAVRQLGRLITIGTCVGFSATWIIPALLRATTSSIAILTFAQETDVAKVAMILGLLITIRYFRIPLGKNISGILWGFAFYVTVGSVIFTGAILYGRDLFAQALYILLPSSYFTCLLVWVVALWRYEPIQAKSGLSAKHAGVLEKSLGAQLGHYRTLLVRSLRK
jgi:hypothetical protein